MRPAKNDPEDNCSGNELPRCSGRHKSLARYDRLPPEMPNDTLDEIEARVKARLIAFPGRDQIALDAAALIEMVRVRDRVVEAARRTSMTGHRLHIPTRMMDEIHELDEVLAALDTPPPAQEPTK